MAAGKSEEMSHPIDDEDRLVGAIDKGILRDFSALHLEDKKLFFETRRDATISEFPHDLLVEIAKRLKKLEDFTSFRCVSRFFHQSIEEEYFQGPLIRDSLPYLLIPSAGRDGNNDLPHMLYSLVEGESVVTSLVIPAVKADDTVYFESLGWLLMIDKDGNMILVDPFSSTEISVPSLTTFPNAVRERFKLDNRLLINKMVLSAKPNESKDFILMVVICTQMCYWRSGDKAWNMIHSRKTTRDVVYGGDQVFYSIASLGFIRCVNFSSGHVACDAILPYQSAVAQNMDPFTGLYIVKAIDGSLLVIKRTRDHKLFLTSGFELYSVDTEGRSLTRIASLGKMALFVGRNSTVALDTAAYGGVIKANHIYFSDDLETYRNMYYTGDWKEESKDSPGAIGGLDNGIYNYETGDIEPISPVKHLLRNVCPAIWITPNSV